MNLKWIGAILIIASCGLVGFSMAAGYCREERSLHQLIGALDFIACELQYRMTPLPDLCRQAGAEKNGCAGKVLTELAVQLESRLQPDVQSCMRETLSTIANIPEKTKEAFELLGSSLGRFDADGQLKGLESVRGFCRREAEKLALGKSNRLRSYQTLGICAGAALAIIFV